MYANCLLFNRIFSLRQEVVCALPIGSMPAEDRISLFANLDVPKGRLDFVPFWYFFEKTITISCKDATKTKYIQNQVHRFISSFHFWLYCSSTVAGTVYNWNSAQVTTDPFSPGRFTESWRAGLRHVSQLEADWFLHCPRLWSTVCSVPYRACNK